MSWIQENLQVLATLGSALSVYILIRIGSKKDVKDLEKRFNKFEIKMDKIEEKIDVINTRLTRLEGRFEERGYWESREYRKNGTEEK